MNKKILWGSIIAVVILVLVSFTGVVGYQTTKSSTIAKASPLFTIRSNRALDKASKDLTCDYVGKGEESVLSIPKRDDRTASQQKFNYMIGKMDNRTFNKFINSVIKRIYQCNKVGKDVTLEQLQLLYHLKNPTKVLNPLSLERNIATQPKRITIVDMCDRTWDFDTWECIISWLFSLFIYLPLMIILEIFTLIPNCQTQILLG